MLFESLIFEYMALLVVEDGASVRTVLCAEDDGATNVLLNAVESEYSNLGREDLGDGKYPILFLESLMLEYMVLLAVDDGMLEKTVCAEEGGPATMLPAPDDERVDASVRTVLCAEEDAATSVLFGLVEFEYPDFGREDPGVHGAVDCR
ncbi:hypothetical protein BGZ74_010447 [Mortierella antarctica]|nr:hypothetical protein BGZ74_010447 [Mortierella antarctica]